MKFTIRFDYIHRDRSGELEANKYNAVILSKKEEYKPLMKQLESWNYYLIFPESNYYVYKRNIPSPLK